MSSNQTNQVDPGDSATDLTSPLHDQADEHAHASSAAGQSSSAPIPPAGVNDEHMENGDGLFPGQTADEQNLEVDVCQAWKTASRVLAYAEQKLTFHL